MQPSVAFWALRFLRLLQLLAKISLVTGVALYSIFGFESDPFSTGRFGT
jgi:hypothetical protein